MRVWLPDRRSRPISSRFSQIGNERFTAVPSVNKANPGLSCWNGEGHQLPRNPGPEMAAEADDRSRFIDKQDRAPAPTIEVRRPSQNRHSALYRSDPAYAARLGPAFARGKRRRERLTGKISSTDPQKSTGGVTGGSADYGG